MAAERRKCFSILGLQESASEAEIKKAYKKLALQYHPDKNDSDDAKSKFQEIGYAYKYLTEGPSAFETADPHDVREEFLRRMFEEMFFARFRGPFGGFPFFCEESDDDDYYMYSDSSDDCYCGSCHTKGSKGNNRRSYQNTYPRAQPAPPNFPPPSKKQLRKREKRQKQKERAKERKEQKRNERQTENQTGKQPSKDIYTDDVNPQPQKEAGTEPKKPAAEKSEPKEDSSTKSEDKNDTGSSRPDTPILNQQPQKLNKKQRKKMESEQRKREREMEEIAAELKKKHEREMEKQREKERLAAQRKEEEKENEMNFSHFFESGKKSRKARQREKRRQESGSNKEPVTQRENSNSSAQSGKPLHNLNVNNSSSSTGKGKEKNGPSMNKNSGPKVEFKKPGSHVNRFDILDDIDDIDDNISRPRSGGSVSSSGSLKNSHLSGGSSQPTTRTSENSGYTSQATGFGFSKHNSSNTGSFKEQNKANGPKPDNTPAGHTTATEGNKQFKSRTYQNSNWNQNNSNSAGDFIHFQTYSDIGTRDKTSGVSNESRTSGNRNEKKFENDKEAKKSPKLNSSLSDDMKSGVNDFGDGGEREFVKDWSVFYSDEEDNLDNLDLGYGVQQNVGNAKGSRYYGQTTSQDNFRYGYDSSYHPKTDTYQQQGFPHQRREFIPRTRGYHGPDAGPYYNCPPGFPLRMRGPPPFPGGNMYPPPPPPHFRGGYPVRPAPRFRGGGYPGQRNGPPMGMPTYSYGKPEGSVPPGFSHYGGERNIPDDRKKNIESDGRKTKSVNSKKSFKSDVSDTQDVNKENISGAAPQNVHRTSKTQSRSNERVPSPNNISKPPEKGPDSSSQFVKNIFSNIQDNQADSGGSLDSLDDFIVYETGPAPTDNQRLRESREGTPPTRPSSYPLVDMGLDEFLSIDNLGVPAGMFSASIKNYYK